MTADRREYSRKGFPDMMAPPPGGVAGPPPPGFPPGMPPPHISGGPPGLACTLIQTRFYLFVTLVL